MNFCKRETGLWMIALNAIMTGQRGFESAAETCAVYRGDDRHRERFEPREQRLSAATERPGIRRALQREKFVDVGAREPRVGLAGGEHHAADRCIARDLLANRC